MKKTGIKESVICPCGKEAQTTAHVLQSIPTLQTRKGKHLTNRKFPRKQNPWNSHRHTHDGSLP